LRVALVGVALVAAIVVVWVLLGRKTDQAAATPAKPEQPTRPLIRDESASKALEELQTVKKRLRKTEDRLAVAEKQRLADAEERRRRAEAERKDRDRRERVAREVIEKLKQQEANERERKKKLLKQERIIASKKAGERISNYCDRMRNLYKITGQPSRAYIDVIYAHGVLISVHSSYVQKILTKKRALELFRRLRTVEEGKELAHLAIIGKAWIPWARATEQRGGERGGEPPPFPQSIAGHLADTIQKPLLGPDGRAVFTPILG
jgi:hypothetical protein